MGLFDSVTNFLQDFTPIGRGGLFNGLSPVDYNGFYNDQSVLYKEELARRAQQFAANETINANAASVNLLKQGNKPVGTSNAKGVDFQKLQDEFANSISNTSVTDARSGANLAGLNNDSLDIQKRANTQALANDQQRLLDSIGQIDLSNISGRI